MHLTQVDFLSPPRGSSRTGLVLLVIGALCAGAAVLDDSTRDGVAVQLQARLEKVKTAYQRAELAQAGTSGQGINLAGIAQPDAVARRLATPWGRLLEVLEQAQSNDVALLGIEPDANRGYLRLSGEARDMNALVDYIKALEGKGDISELRLLTQQIKQSDTQLPIEFVLESRWHKSGATSDAGAPS